MSTAKKEALFLSVIEQNKGIIYKIASSFKKDGEDKKDLIQEIILQLWRSIGTYNEQSKLSTWMYRVALNVAIASYRKEKKKNQLISPLTEGMLAFADADQPDETDANLRLLQQFISELKELDRALMLLYLDEKNGKEIAEILGLSESNVRTKINRIKEKLKQRFNNIYTQ